MNLWLKHSSKINYVDDTSSSISAKELAKLTKLLEEDAQNLLNFMASNGLLANAKKCQNGQQKHVNWQHVAYYLLPKKWHFKYQNNFISIFSAIKNAGIEAFMILNPGSHGQVLVWTPNQIMA